MMNCMNIRDIFIVLFHVSVFDGRVTYIEYMTAVY